MRLGIVVLATLLAAPALAQSPPGSVSGSATQVEQARRQQQVRLMERALEEAVARGVRTVEQQLPSVPGVVFFAGPVRVRGFELEDYGVFFDVEYPVVRRSILWSMSTLQLNGGLPTVLQLNGGLPTVLQDLRRRLQMMPEGPGQLAFEQILSEMESELQRTTPLTSTPAGRGAARVSSTDAETRPERPVAVDPLETYMTALRGELTDVVISNGPALAVEEDHWVSVAARDGRGQVDPRVSTPRRTLRLRVRGRDLAALSAGRLSVDQVRLRVEAP